MYADLTLDNAAMKGLIAKNCKTDAQARGSAVRYFDDVECTAAHAAGGVLC